VNVHHYINVNYASSVAQLWPDAVFDDCGVRWDSVDNKLFFSTTSLCSASYIGCQCNTARICCERRLRRRCCMLRAPAAGTQRRRPPLSIDISCQKGALQQTRRPPMLLSIDGTDRQTDARPFHRPCSAYHASSVNKKTKELYHADVVNESGRKYRQTD